MYQFKYDWYEHIASKQFDYCDKTYVNVASSAKVTFFQIWHLNLNSNGRFDVVTLNSGDQFL